MALPNLIITGFPKCGTTSLFNYLDAHSSVCVSSIKETQFFLHKPTSEIIASIGDYENYFKGCEGSRVILEASPGYAFLEKNKIQLIHEILPNSKIIFLIRNPLKRLESFYNHLTRNNLINEQSFEDYLIRIKNDFILSSYEELDTNNYYFKGLRGGYYEKYISRWINIYGKNNVLILTLEGLENNTQQVVKDTAAWLGLNTNEFDEYNFEISNKNLNVRNKKLHRFLTVNRVHFEAFFRKNPKTKKRILKIYHVINKKSNNKNIVEPELLEIFKSHYFEKNSGLLNITENNHNNCHIDWLE